MVIPGSRGQEHLGSCLACRATHSLRRTTDNVACLEAGGGCRGEGLSHTCILLLRSLRGVLVHGWVVVRGLLWGPMHGILRMLGIRVLCQVAGCICNVVHAACTQSINQSSAFQVKRG